MAGGAALGALIGGRFKKDGWKAFDPATVPESGPNLAVEGGPRGVRMSLITRF
jgi:hypothetical protein